MVMGYLMTLGMNCADPNMGKPKPGRIMPVSYTHLDVYKRQECTGLL